MLKQIVTVCKEIFMFSYSQVSTGDLCMAGNPYLKGLCLWKTSPNECRAAM